MSLGSVAVAQQKLPDAQVEANVLKAFAGAPQLANQAITATTVDGVVTLTGFAQDEASRTLAETLASKALGVQKVVDQLALGAGAPPDEGQAAGTAAVGWDDGAAAAGWAAGRLSGSAAAAGSGCAAAVSAAV